MTVHIHTKRYEGQRVTSWRQPATQTNRDPDRDKTLARSNHLTTPEIHRCQDDVFWYKLQFLLSGVLPVFWSLNTIYGEDCLRCCLTNNLIKRDSKMFQAIGGLHEDNLCDTLQGTAPTNVKTVNQTSLFHIESNLDRLGLLSPTHGERSRQVQVFQGHTSCQNKENNNIEIHGAVGLESAKPAREPAPSLPKPCTSLENAPQKCPFLSSLLALVGRKQIAVRDPLSTQKPPGSRL